MTTYTLRNMGKEYCLSGSTIARLQAAESVSTNTLDALCHILDCQLTDIVIFIPDNI
ncbi:helix-turn-helix domain-containing protein [Eisenbergiella tayi]